MTLNAGVPAERPSLNSGSFPAARLRRAVPTWRSAFPRLGVTLHGGVGPRGEPPPNSGSFPAARLRRAVPTGGRRSRACASLSTVAWSREANHPRTRLGVLPCRPPAAGCADLEVGVPWPARHSPRWRGAERRTTPELGVLPCRPPAAACADLEVGVPWPGRHSPRWRGAERRTTPELGVLPCRPPAAGCADRRSAFPCLRVTLHGGVEPRGEPPPNSARGPSLPPACGGLCRPGGRRSLAWASLSTVAWGREANHPRNTRNEPERYPPRPHDTDDHGQSSGRSQSPAFTGLFRI